MSDNKREISLLFESPWNEPWMLLNDIAMKYDLTIENTWDIEMMERGSSKYPIDSYEEVYDRYRQEHENMKMQVAALYRKE